MIVFVAMGRRRRFTTPVLHVVLVTMTWVYLGCARVEYWLGGRLSVRLLLLLPVVVFMMSSLVMVMLAMMFVAMAHVVPFDKDRIDQHWTVAILGTLSAIGREHPLPPFGLAQDSPVHDGNGSVRIGYTVFSQLISVSL